MPTKRYTTHMSLSFCTEQILLARYSYHLWNICDAGSRYRGCVFQPWVSIRCNCTMYGMPCPADQDDSTQPSAAGQRTKCANRGLLLDHMNRQCILVHP